MTINNVIPNHLESLINKLLDMGVSLKINKDSITVSAISNLKSAKIKTLGYPGFPTDLQQIMTVLLTQATGLSIVEETIYENRFNNVKYLNQMGANINIEGKKIFISGPTKLKGAMVEATDLRAGACMVLAGLVAHGTTTITNVEHILRGYENIVGKLESIGAKIELLDI